MYQKDKDNRRKSAVKHSNKKKSDRKQQASAFAFSQGKNEQVRSAFARGKTRDQTL